MASVASGGTAERIVARILFRVVRAGSGTAARYSSTFFAAALPFAAEARLPDFVFFIEDLPNRFVRPRLRSILHQAELAAQPSAGQRGDDEREGIPVGPQGRHRVPRRDSTDDADDKAYGAAHESVLHGPIRSEARNDVAARDAVDDAIRGGKQEERIAHRRLPQGREDAGGAQRDIGAEGENYAGGDAG